MRILEKVYTFKTWAKDIGVAVVVVEVQNGIDWGVCKINES